MDNEFIHIPNDNEQDYTFCRIKLLFETFEQFWTKQSKLGKIPKVSVQM